MSEIVHPVHPHILCSVTHGRLYTCSGCKEHGYGHSYQCKQEQCNYNLHIQCATAARSIIHRFLGSHTYLLRYSPPPRKRWVCEACSGDVDGFGYYCEKKRRSLHPCCAKLDPASKVDVEEMELSLQPKISSMCNWCGVGKLKDRPGGWSYVSHCRNFNFHVGCIKNFMVENWTTARMRNDGDDHALMGTAPSNGLVRYDGSTDLSRRRLKRYWQVVKALFRSLLSVFHGTPPTMEVNMLVACVFESKTESKDLGYYNAGKRL